MSKARTDRVVIAIALLLLLLAGSAFYFDGWMWGSRRARGERIGVITSREGDVRLKFEDDLKWSRAANGQDLSYDDAVYAGSGSEAKLKVGQSQMTVKQNSLIVLRRDQSQNFLRLNYGTLFGLVAKNDKIVIDTGDGKKFELEATQDTNIILRRDSGRTQLDVTSGEANVRVDGKQNRVTTSSRLVFGERTRTQLQVNHLRALKPLRDQVIANAEPTRIQFDWAWDSGRRATEDEEYVLEFSDDADFKRLHARKVVRGELTSSLSVSQSLSLLYRVRAPDGQLSQVERVRFVRLDVPRIVTPLAEQRFEIDPGLNTDVDLTFERPPGAPVVEYQVARDADFTDVLREGRVADRGRESLGGGAYAVRARANFGGLGVSPWTPPRPFRVDLAPQILPLANRRAPGRVTIPNRPYPSDLYAADDQRVRDFLQSRGWLQKFLPLKAGEYDEVRVKSGEDGREYVSNTPAWPNEKLGPGAYTYRYQTSKSGFLPSAWSPNARLEVTMEPPKPVGEARFGERDDDDLTPTTFGFTPLLFARSYDVEVATTPTFDDATELKTTEPKVETKLAEGSYFWRARARDERGRLISAYSAPYRMAPLPPAKVPQFLAQREPQAVVERVVTKVVPGPEVPIVRNGWYAWLGTGENFTKYDQSINGRGTANFHQIRPGSQFFEGGFTSLGGVGGVLAYKATPGDVELKNASLAANAYRWTTLTAEAMMRKLTNWSFRGTPVTYGMRAGVQMHRTPFLVLDDASNVTLQMNDMTTATIGLLADWTQSRWKYYSLVRYQFPLSTKSDGSSQFAISPTFAFDGSIGMSYNLTQRFKLGAFIYGQWHQYNFTYVTPKVTNVGFQSLFYSSADVRLGYEF